MTVDMKKIADQADVIIDGYATLKRGKDPVVDYVGEE